MKFQAFHAVIAAFLLPVILGQANPAAADSRVYRWTDEEGNVHFGDRPTDKSRASEVEIRDAAPPDPHLQERRQREQKLMELFDEERAGEREATEQQRENRRIRRKNCAIARERQSRYAAVTGVYETDAEGNKIVLPEAALEESRAIVRREVEKWCGKQD